MAGNARTRRVASRRNDTVAPDGLAPTMNEIVAVGGEDVHAWPFTPDLCTEAVGEGRLHAQPKGNGAVRRRRSRLDSEVEIDDQAVLPPVRLVARDTLGPAWTGVLGPRIRRRRATGMNTVSLLLPAWARRQLAGAGGMRNCNLTGFMERSPFWVLFPVLRLPELLLRDSGLCRLERTRGECREWYGRGPRPNRLGNRRGARRRH